MSRNLERIPLYAVRTSLPRSLTCLIERQILSEGLFSKNFYFHTTDNNNQAVTHVYKKIWNGYLELLHGFSSTVNNM